MQVTRGTVSLMFAAMQKLGAKPTKKRFAYGLAKNKTIIEAELKAIQEAEKDLIPYEEERVELCKKHSALVNGGEPKFENGRYQGLIGNSAFIDDFNSLNKKYEKELIESRIFLSESINIDFYPIALEDFPDEITPGDMDILISLVKE